MRKYSALIDHLVASSLRSPSSPKGTPPLTSKEDQDAWDAGYEAASYHATSGHPRLDVESLFVWASGRDSRIPRHINEENPKFWEYLHAFGEGVSSYAEGKGIQVTGVPKASMVDALVASVTLKAR